MNYAKIALAITTRNRRSAFMQSIAAWATTRHPRISFFVVDDASEFPYADADYRFKNRAGIAKAKNKALELAYDSGARHIFLADDDIYPINIEWWKPYVNSGQHHLCYCFKEGYGNTPSKMILGTTADLKFNVYSSPNGCLMYFTRECIDKVGGFDEEYGLGFYEHTDLSLRIHNAGLTRFPFMDVVGSDSLFYSMDRHGEIERTFSSEERDLLIRANSAYFEKNKFSSRYVEFRSKPKNCQDCQCERCKKASGSP